MRWHFRQLWKDDSAAVLSSELVLIMGIVVFGIVPGLIAIRNSTIAALATVGNLISVLTPQVTFSQVSVSPDLYQVMVNFNIPSSGVVGVNAELTDPTVVTFLPVSPSP